MISNQTFCLNGHMACKRCIHYEELDLEILRFEKDQVEKREMKKSCIIYILNGDFFLSSEDIYNQRTTSGNIFILPLGKKVYIHSDSSLIGTILMLPIKEEIHFCEHLKIENLYDIKEHQSNFFLMKSNNVIDNFFIGLMECVNNIKCKQYMEIKQKELFSLLHYYYSRQDLVELFSPLISGDAAFKSFLLKNISTERTVKRLATKANLSIRTFHTHFKKAIGVTPSQWINQEKAKQIRYELIFTNKPIKQICEDFGFTSPSYFNEFCKKNLYNTPAKLRKENSSTIIYEMHNN